MVVRDIKLSVREFSAEIGNKTVLKGISFEVRRGEIFAIIGPAQSGKTTLLKSINRTTDSIQNLRMSGSIALDGEDIFRVSNVATLRRRIGMVSPLPVGLPMSIYDNVAFAPRMAGLKREAELDDHVESCLRRAALWDEVKDRLNSLGTTLSGGQQQRLTIARALSHSPEVLCLDEFSIAIDPVTTTRIEEVLGELRETMTIILVTNLVQQARRVSDRTMFLLNGEQVDLLDTVELFSPGTKLDPRTRAYIEGDFG